MPVLSPELDHYIQGKDQYECTPLHIAILRGKLAADLLTSWSGAAAGELHPFRASLAVERTQSRVSRD